MTPRMYRHAASSARFVCNPAVIPGYSSDLTPPKVVLRAPNWLPAFAAALMFSGGTANIAAQQSGQDLGQDQGWSQSAPNDDRRQYGQAPPSQPLSAGQLEQLVAPIALYPDALVAQVLAASTYPSQVLDADRWRQAQGYASPGQIAAGADMQSWDPAVKALTPFPRVLEQMSRNLQWTTDLGNAYYNQPQDVMEAVQVMRRRAQAVGTLQSTPQEVVRYNQGYIELAPPTPEVVYVPTYNPWAAYGEPVTPYPGFSLLGAIGEFFAGGPLRYGLGIAMGAFTHTPWGWLAWGLNWLTQAVLFDHSDYYSHSATVADWGFGHGGFHAYRGPGAGWGEHYGRMREGVGWRHGGLGGGEWHSFARRPDTLTRNWGEHSNRGGFQAFRGDSRTLAGYRPPGRMQEGRSGYASGFYGGSGAGSGRSLQSYRASSSFRGSAFGSRSSGSLSGSGSRSSSGRSHWFGGGHSQRSFGGGHSGGFHMGGGGHASKGFGGVRSFGGGHSHGGGGHSGGHGGGHHH